MIVNDILVICRPDQLREAAVVLSCCDPGAFTPLIVIDRPPCDESEYRTRYDEYVNVRNERDAWVAYLKDRKIPRSDKSKLVWLNAEVDAKAERLTAFRSWWRHHHQISKLLGGLSLRRAIFLFPPESEATDSIVPMVDFHLSDRRESFIPGNLDRIALLAEAEGSTAGAGCPRQCYRSLAGLSELAWSACGRGEPYPDSQVEVPEGDLSSWFTGLHQALRHSLPLRPAGVPSRAPAIEGGSDSEAVLIEVRDDASLLLGVQYALLRGARLVLSPRLDPAGIDEVRASIEGGHSRPKGRRLTEMLQSAHQYWFGKPDFSIVVRRLEETVSSLVPEAVVEGVGARALTAFTEGIPYNFLKKGGADWSGKPIGHITGDTLLLILTEVCQAAREATPGFSVIFDPGAFSKPEFNTGETELALKSLNERISHPLVLRRAASTSLALQHLGGTLPLDVLYFNTHGADNSILLADGNLPSFKIQQRVSLTSHPFVFNSSCLSWVGVGREFVRVGARGYLGTLWSIDSLEAAKFTGTVFGRLTGDQMPVSQAIRHTDADPATERAYIFIGTCGARLTETPPADAEQERQRSFRIATTLLDSLTESLKRSANKTVSMFVEPFQKLLREHCEKLVSAYFAQWPDPHLDALDLTLSYLNMRSYTLQYEGADSRRHLDLFTRIAEWPRLLRLDAKVAQSRFSRIQHLMGRMRLAEGNLNSAIEFLSKSVQAARQSGEPVLPPALELCDALRRAQRPREALTTIKNALASATGKDPDALRLRLLAIGRLGQISLSLNEFEASLTHAREGFSLATQLDDLSERAEFKGDEARTLLRLGRFDEALEAAKEFLRLAQLAFDSFREISAQGVMSQAYLGKGDLKSAMTCAQLGLSKARDQNYQDAVGDFLMDLAKITAKGNDHADGFNRALDAASVFGQAKDATKARNSMGFATNEYNRLVDQNPKSDHWSELTRIVNVELSLLEIDNTSLRQALAVEVVLQPGRAILRMGLPKVRDKVLQLTREANKTLIARREQTSPEVSFVTQAFSMFEAMAEGRQDEAMNTARALDKKAGTGGQFTKLVETANH